MAWGVKDKSELMSHMPGFDLPGGPYFSVEARYSKILRVIGQVLVIRAAHAQQSIRQRQGCSMHPPKIVTNCCIKDESRCTHLSRVWVSLI